MCSSKVLEGLKALELVGHEKGRTRFRKVPEWGVSATLPGRASRFWATAQLIEFAEHRGIRLDNIGDHFQPEPPHNPLVLRDYATGKGVNRERGQIIKNYTRTTHTKRLAADIRELNEFLAGETSRVVSTTATPATSTITPGRRVGVCTALEVAISRWLRRSAYR